MATISKESIDVLRSAAEVHLVADSVDSQEEIKVAAAVINSAANAGQTSCVIERRLSPATIQDLVDNEYQLEGFGRADKNIPYIVDWSRSVTKSVAGDYEDIGVNSIVYNKKSLSEFMWVELPRLAKNFIVAAITQIQPMQSESLDISQVSQENIWLKIPVALIDVTAGQKIYKMQLKHNSLEDTMTLYFSYIIQDDEPDKSYVYMK